MKENKNKSILFTFYLSGQIMKNCNLQDLFLTAMKIYKSDHQDKNNSNVSNKRKIKNKGK